MRFPDTGIAIIAPSGCAPDPDWERGLSRLQDLGLSPHPYYQHDQRYLRFGGSDQERLTQLHAAVQNPQVEIVMALRGSYGLSRLLHLIDWDLLAASGKLLCGYSDFTALNCALLQLTGAASFSGPMLCDDFTRADCSEFTHGEFVRCLLGPEYLLQWPQNGDEHSLLPQAVEGRLWGGNLAMLVSLLGSPYFPQVQDGILFLEDIAEHPYRIERMLLQLMHAGVLQKQRALILGDFSAYRLSPYDNGYDFAAMLAFIRSQTRLPVLTGLPYGHTRERACLPVGSEAKLWGEGGTWHLRARNYPRVAAHSLPEAA